MFIRPPIGSLQPEMTLPSRSMVKRDVGPQLHRSRTARAAYTNVELKPCSARVFRSASSAADNQPRPPARLMNPSARQRPERCLNVVEVAIDVGVVEFDRGQYRAAGTVVKKLAGPCRKSAVSYSSPSITKSPPPPSR